MIEKIIKILAVIPRRHFVVSMLLSLPIPGLAGLIAHHLGAWYERRYPSDDADADMKENAAGILAGTVISTIIWLSILGG